MTVSDIDIFRSANLHLDQHGDQAVAKAREMVRTMKRRGNHDGRINAGDPNMLNNRLPKPKSDFDEECVAIDYTEDAGWDRSGDRLGNSRMA